MSVIRPFSDEQLRVLVNLEQRYGGWIEAEQTLFNLPYDLRRKEVGGRSYLYEITGRDGNGRSLGPWSRTNEDRLADFRQRKAEAKSRIQASWPEVVETCRLYRALRLPMLASEAGAILREADRRRLLGSHLLVVGTNAVVAYSIEAGGLLQLPDETYDFELTWAAAEREGTELLWNLLKAVDPTFTVNTERTFQARNAKAYEIEILAAPSRAATMFRTDRPQPVPLPEQEWLLLGKPIEHIVGCRDNKPARIIVPDPRYFALQKLWLAKQAKRNPLKRPKDDRQGRVLLTAVSEAMPQYPIDRSFEASLPPELAELLREWRQTGPSSRTEG
jgi:hypothetical protein